MTRNEKKLTIRPLSIRLAIGRRGLSSYSLYSRPLGRRRAISRTSGRGAIPGEEGGKTRGTWRMRAPKFVQFVIVAALMEWYLQTRTNSPINYKTISPPTGAQNAYRLPQDAERRRASSCLRRCGVPPHLSRNFWSPASPRVIRGGGSRPSSVPPLPAVDSANIWRWKSGKRVDESAIRRNRVRTISRERIVARWWTRMN